jgi:hypothetical protein
VPEEMGQKTFIPSRSYDIQLTIKDRDYSNDLVKCQIMSSTNTIYIAVKLELFIDARDILTDITGEDPLKLTITPIGNVIGDLQEKFEVELMYIKSSFEMPIKPLIYKPHQVDRTSFPIICVPRKCFQTMTSVVNNIYMGQTIQSIIQDLVNSVGNGSTLVMDTEGLNNEKIDQILIPPSTLANAINYLDKTFGIYNGICNYSCSDNIVSIRNLTKRLTKESTLTIYQLASDDKENTNLLSESSKKPNVYYTYDQVNLTYGGNSKASTLSKNIKHIVKPSNTLFYEINQDLEVLAEDYGLSFSTQNNKKIKLDSIIDNRTRYYIDHTGYETDEYFAVANLSRLLANTSMLNFRIERSFNLLPVLDVGNNVKFNSKISEYINLTGNYILRSSIIDFTRTRDWEAIGSIYLMRTNQDR